jgi:hypothetical protein
MTKTEALLQAKCVDVVNGETSILLWCKAGKLEYEKILGI